MVRGHFESKDWFGLCCLMTPGLIKDIRCLLNLQNQTTHIVGCQPGDCIWSLKSSSGLCGYVWVNIPIKKDGTRKFFKGCKNENVWNAILNGVRLKDANFWNAKLNGLTIHGKGEQTLK